MIATTTLALSAIAAAIGITYWVKHRPVKDIVIPAPAVLRTDLLYGYYGAMDGQVLDTLGHINMLWECQFQGWTKAADNILAARLPTLLDLANQLFKKVADHGKNYVVNPDGETSLRELLNYLKNRGALQYIKYLYPMDEPNTNVATPQDFLAGINTAIKVAAEFPELDGVMLACIYAAAPASWTCIEKFDRVGVNNYDDKSHILVSTYLDLLFHKREDAKTILLPGGAFGQDITPFINFAHLHEEVAMVVPFVWFGPMVPADKWVGIGNPANPRKIDYITAGQVIVRGAQ